jgi:hypothetical protein
MTVHQSRVKRRLRLRWVLAGVAVLIAGWAVTCFAVISRPALDDPTYADAVVLLGPPDEESLAMVGDLAAAGFSNDLVIFTPFGEPEICGAPPRQVRLTCLVPNPSSTRGEAQAIARMAEARDWSSIAVVTWTEHISRSRVLVERCYDGPLYMLAFDDAAPLVDSLGGWIYETGAFVKTFLQRGC